MKLVDFKVGQLVKVQGFEIKNDNGIYKIDSIRDCLTVKRVKLNGEYTSDKYNLNFINEGELDKVTLLNGVEDLKQAKKEVNEYLKNRDDNEIVVSYEAVADQEIKEGSIIRFKKGLTFGEWGGKYIGTKSIWLVKRCDRNLAIVRLGKKGQVLSLLNDKNSYCFAANLYKHVVDEDYVEVVEKIESRKGDLLKEVKKVNKSSKTSKKQDEVEDIKESKDTENIEGMEVVFNEEKNGIELFFSNKPSKELLAGIKANGFRAGKRNGQWYWWAKDTEERREFVLSLQASDSKSVESQEVKKPKLIDVKDCVDINTLKHKYVTNWDKLPQEIQDYILSCDTWWVESSQELLIYKGRKIAASLSIDLWDAEIEIAYLGSKSMQWGFYMREGVIEAIEKRGFVLNSDNGIWYKQERKEETIESIEKYEIKDISNKDVWVSAVMPNLNKNCNKSVNDEEIKASSFTETYKITDIIILEKPEYKFFCNNLLKDYDFLSQKGGREESESGNVSYGYAVVVYCEDEEILIVNPSGSSYARYCGKIVEDIEDTLKNEMGIKIPTINFENMIGEIQDNELYEVEDVSNDLIKKDQRFILSQYLNGMVVVTGQDLKQLAKDGRIQIKDYTNSKCRFTLETLLESILKMDSGMCKVLDFGLKTGLEEIKFFERLEKNLRRVNK